MPHIKGYPMAGHGKKHRVSGADESFRGQAWIDEEETEELPSRATGTLGVKANICEEAGDCADRVNEEGLSPEAKQILRDAERVSK